MKLNQLNLGLLLFGLVGLLALLAPWLSVQGLESMDLQKRFLPPQWPHPMGTDQHGRDVFTQILWGGRLSLFIGLCVVSFSLFLGLIIGAVAGYCLGWVDRVLMAVVNLIFAFPGFLLVLALAAISQGASVLHLILILSLTGWPTYARLVRGEVINLKSEEYVLMGQALGLGHTRLLISHMLPNLWPPLLVHATFGVAGVILTEASLSFLGVGLPVAAPSWGQMLNSGRHFLLEAPHISAFPSLALFMTALAFFLIGGGLQQKLSPQLSRARPLTQQALLDKEATPT